jgi:hypothetical protein
MIRWGHATVEKHGDVGMLKARQDVALGGKSTMDLGSGAAVDEPEGDCLLEHIVIADRAVDTAHAAAANSPTIR